MGAISQGVPINSTSRLNLGHFYCFKTIYWKCFWNFLGSFFGVLKQFCTVTIQTCPKSDISYSITHISAILQKGNHGYSHWIWAFPVSMFPEKPMQWLKPCASIWSSVAISVSTSVSTSHDFPTTLSTGQWIGLRNKLQENPLFNGKINGFRFRFSCKPIHWTGASEQPECYMPSQGELNPAAQAIWIVNLQGYQIWGAGDLRTNLYKRSSGGSPWDKPATTIQLQRDFDRINLINDIYIYIYYYIDLY